MRPAYSVEATRAADRLAQQTTSEAVLIDRASAAVARRGAALLGTVYGARVVVLAGSGHNGADALWAGVKLRDRGAQVDVVVAADPKDEHGAEPLRRLRGLGARDVGGAAVGAADLVVDGLVGVGFTGSLRQADLAEAAGTARAVLAVDVPSGVDADTGAVAGAAVRADVTVTFGGLKPGLLLDPGAEYAGVVEVADIGLADLLAEPVAEVLDADDVHGAMLEPPRESSKYTRGVVGVVAGGDRYTGAAVLACGGAVRAGAGMVYLFSSPGAVDVVRAAWPEVVAFADPDPARISDNDKVGAWVVGPGLGTDDRALGLVRAVLASDRPAVVDADAITLAAHEPALLQRAAPTVVTPHLREFERLTGVGKEASGSDRLGTARRAAGELAVTVLLKGTTTVVAGPDGSAYINPTGTPWLGTAGTGDVLAGAVGALLAGGLGAPEAAAVASWLHGLAGRLAADAGGDPEGAPISAGDLLTTWPAAVRATRS
ncbi:MAG TPA: NAD(P)H-hydrate dehydratase [Mycobacteriales bacterium]|jgi:hydroxyethylthiazole kinase-like uncharacterized protein yjeF|nr:NAD(P)H-hydrate dehydratase [Mycobacteriales bacterium]